MATTAPTARWHTSVVARDLAVVALTTVALVAAGCSTSDNAADTTTTSTTSDSSASSTESTANASGSDCPSANFDLTVNDYVPEGDLPAPELAVQCTDGNLVVTTNDVIGYEFVQMTPNGLEAQDFNFEIPLEPVEAQAPGAMGLGQIGVAINGVVFFAAFEAPNDGYQDPLLDGLLDFCNGHTAMQGLYHYHARPDCIVGDPMEPGTVFGYIFDGYELVSPYVCDDDDCASTKALKSSYVKTGDGLGAFEDWTYEAAAGDLDECNGTTGDDGVYRYYATDDFPYVPFCFHGETSVADGEFTGEPPADNGPAGGPPA